MAQGYGLNHSTATMCTSFINHSVKLQPFLSSISSFECFIPGSPDSIPDSFGSTTSINLDCDEEEEEENCHSRFFSRSDEEEEEEEETCRSRFFSISDEEDEEENCRSRFFSISDEEDEEENCRSRFFNTRSKIGTYFNY